MKNSADKTDYISATGAASFTHVGDVTHCWMGVVTAAHGITGINLGIIAACLLIRHAALRHVQQAIAPDIRSNPIFRCYLN